MPDDTDTLGYRYRLQRDNPPVHPANPPPQSADPYGTGTPNRFAAGAHDLGMSPYDWESEANQQFANANINAMQATGNPAGSYGYMKLPAGTSWADFMALESAVNQFVASSGSRYQPTANQMLQMMQQGLYNQPASAVSQWLARAQGVSNKLPWAAAGMTATQYANAKMQLEATMAEYTGDPNTYGDLINTALAKGGYSGGADAWLRAQLTTNKTYTQNAKTPWLQYGMNHQAWQSWKLQNKGQVQQMLGDKPLSEVEATKAYAAISSAPKIPQSGTAIATPVSQQQLVQPAGQTHERP